MFFRVVFLFFLSLTIGSACYVDCTPYAMTKSQQAQAEVTKAYAELDVKILELEQKYQAYLLSLKEQNNLLDNIVEVRKYNSLKMQEVSFLLKKIVDLKGVQIDMNLLNDIKKYQESNIAPIKAKLEEVIL